LNYNQPIEVSVRRGTREGYTEYGFSFSVDGSSYLYNSSIHGNKPMKEFFFILAIMTSWFVLKTWALPKPPVPM